MRFFLLALALTAISVDVSAQISSTTRPKGFMKLNWGATRSEVLEALRDESVSVPEADTGGDTLAGRGGTFAGQTAVAWHFDFAGGRFYSATVSLRGEPDRSLYRELKQELINKYGAVSSEGKLGNPTEERRSRALYRTSAKRGAVWKFGPTLQFTDTVSITCEVDTLESEGGTGSLVTIRYTNETTKAQAAAVSTEATAEAPDKKAPEPVKSDYL